MGKVTLRRYTNLAATIHILQNKVITLLDPDTWDDRNDAYFMRQYKERKSAKSVLALCFAEAVETYHHWRVFSPGSDGVCFEFEKKMLLAALNEDPHTESARVKYRQIKNIKKSPPKLEDLPFLKRYPYKDEEEIRVVHVNYDEEIKSKDYEIPLSCIRRLHLSPWMHKSLRNSVTKLLRSIDGCSDLKISRSTLVDNEQWKKVADQFENVSPPTQE